MVLSPIQSFALPVSMQNSQQEIAVITDTSCFLFHPISQLSLVAARRFSYNLQNHELHQEIDYRPKRQA